MKKIDFKKLTIALVLPLLVGLIGSYFTFSEISGWYKGLNKPFFSPPNWLFGPVWTLLYILMGISLYMVWTLKKKNKDSQKGLILFFDQLVLNLLWSILFFSFHSPLMAFICIIILWFTILLVIEIFWKVSRVAGSLLLPYILWVSFATILNFSIVVLNR